MAGPLQFLSDNFDDTTTAAKWSGFATGTSTKAESGGYVVFTPPASTAGSNFAGYDSATTYDLTGSFSVVQVAKALNAVTGAQQYMKLTADASNSIQWMLENGTLKPQKTVATVQSDITAGVTFNAVTHAWWRIIESGGTTFFDFTDNPSNGWTNHTSLTNPITPTAVTVEIACGTYQSVVSPGVGWFDNYNLPIIHSANRGLRPHPFSPGLAR